MTKPPARFKKVEDYTPDEHFATLQARRRGEEPPRFETPERRQARRVALEAAGLAEEADEIGDAQAAEDLAATPEAMSAEDHFQQIRRNR